MYIFIYVDPEEGKLQIKLIFAVRIDGNPEKSLEFCYHRFVEPFIH